MKITHILKQLQTCLRHYHFHWHFLVMVSACIIDTLSSYCFLNNTDELVAVISLLYGACEYQLHLQ
jgi:hypothetical protein